MEVLRGHLLGAVKEIVGHCDLQTPNSPVNYTMSDFSREFDAYIVYNGNVKETVLMFPPALGGAETYLANVVLGLLLSKQS